MSLNWDITEVVNPPLKDNSLTGIDYISAYAVFESIVFGCMATDIGYIKDDAEAIEWYNRYAIWNINNGYDKWTVTLDDVRKYIGLRTNVSRLSRFKWDAKQRKIHDWK